MHQLPEAKKYCGSVCKSILESRNGMLRRARVPHTPLLFTAIHYLIHIIHPYVSLIKLTKIIIKMSKFTVFPLEWMESFLFEIV